VDVVVYGGSPAGAAAAIQASRMGRAVALVAPERHPGGMVVEGLGSADINNHWFRKDTTVGGIAREFYERIGRKYGANGPPFRFESRIAEEVIREMLAESKIAVHRGLRLREPLPVAVESAKTSRTLTAIISESGVWPEYSIARNRQARRALAHSVTPAGCTLLP
jgi:flavin-dependent dehydrogenase